MIINLKFKIITIIFGLLLFILNSNYIFSLFSVSDEKNLKVFIEEVQKEYETFNKVCINQIDLSLDKKQKISEEKINSIINIGFTLDKNYIYETMLTVSSIMATQKHTTKIRLHFGVTKDFTSEKMIKMYELKNKINNLTEFNFYYLKESVTKMKNFHPKGEACPGKFELPILLPDDVERLIIFDAGDLLVLRDLTDLYNYNMNGYWVLGTPEPTIINSFMKVKYNITKYINIGSILLDVKKLKENNFWNIYISSRHLQILGAPDQTLFNIVVPDNKKNYLPFKFGGFSLFSSDINYDHQLFEPFGFKNWLNDIQSSSLPERPKNEKEIIFYLYNPRFIHQFSGKWKDGNGLSIYRLLAKYFILLAGISSELCKKNKGYCL